MIGDLAQALYDISAFLTRRSQWMCQLDGLPLASVTGERLSVTLEFGKLILTLRGDDFSECWRIEAYEIAGERLRLRLSRHWGRQTYTLEIRPDQERSDEEDARSRRRAFESRICQVLQRELGARIEYAATHRDDARHLSGIYTRLILRHRGERAIGIAVNPGEPQAHIDGLVTAGAIWWEHAAHSRHGEGAQRLLLLAPFGRAERLARRLTALRRENPRIELYEVKESEGKLIAVTPFDQGALFDPNRARLPRLQGEPSPHPLRDRALAWAPDLLRVCRRPGSWEESLLLRGLEVARIRGGGLWFGVGARKQKLRENWEDFERLLQEVARIRHPESPEKFHPFYRLQAERWLEEIIRQDVRRVDPRLDPRFLYSQIPAYGDEGYGRVDLLGITEERQLVLMELKVEEDAELPLQALDYWLKIEWHRRRGDFARRGYFPGIEIADRPTQVLVIAPLLRFHSTFDQVARWIDPDVPFYKIGIAEEWRKGVRILYRERANG